MTRWWRFWSELYVIKYRTPVRLAKGLINIIVPCHEDWKMFQPRARNDND